MGHQVRRLVLVRSGSDAVGTPPVKRRLVTSLDPCGKEGRLDCLGRRAQRRNQKMRKARWNEPQLEVALDPEKHLHRIDRRVMALETIIAGPPAPGE